MLTKLELIHKKPGPAENNVMDISMFQVCGEVLDHIWMDLGEIGWERIRMVVRLGIEMQLYMNMRMV